MPASVSTTHLVANRRWRPRIAPANAMAKSSGQRRLSSNVHPALFMHIPWLRGTSPWWPSGPICPGVPPWKGYLYEANQPTWFYDLLRFPWSHHNGQSPNLAMLPSWQDNSAKHATAILAEHQRTAEHGGLAGLMGGHARAAHFLFWPQPSQGLREVECRLVLRARP